MNVFVVFNTVHETPVAVFTTEERAQALCRKAEEAALAKGHSGAAACTWYEYDEFELDREPELDIT